MTSPTNEIASVTEAAVPVAQTTAVNKNATRKAGDSPARKRPAKTSKKDQLLALVAKPGGTRISILTEKLGWQAHTVRATLSGLRKQGHQILATKAPKTGEAVYRLVSPGEVNGVAVEDATP